MLSTIGKWISTVALTAGVPGVASIVQGALADTKAGPPLLEFRIAADRVHDSKIVDEALGAGGWKKPPAGYRWVVFDSRGRGNNSLIVRPADEAENGIRESVLVRTDTVTVTENDLIHISRTVGDGLGPAFLFRLTPAGSDRLGTLTRGHLPTDGGSAKSQLAIIVEGVVLSAPSINAEVRNAGVIELGRESKIEDADRLVKLLGPFAEANEQLTRAKAVKDQDAAIAEAIHSDLPALAEADRFVVESGMIGFQMGSSVPAELAAIRRALKPEVLPPSGGLKAATVSFYRGNNLIRKIWVYEGGEWGFERRGVSWTTGGSPDLWKIVEKYRPKPAR